ncbi:hypothetical protein, partial [Salmonella sp. SAL4433]|uniref:hypothetical protein n=1 Tax=Salmonella sp. SAL4433 TaxID=3159888 RepID=UPI00397B6777
MMGEVLVDPPPPLARKPKTMQELAEESARRNEGTIQRADSEEELALTAPRLPTGENLAANARSTRASRTGAK